MKKKTWIFSGLAVAVVASCFLISGFSSPAPTKKNKSTCCCQKMKNCASKTNDPAHVEIGMENLSWQFLSITSFGY
jgi:hypothetical protein